jgi:hypothetical protein
MPESGTDLFPLILSRRHDENVGPYMQTKTCDLGMWSVCRKQFQLLASHCLALRLSTLRGKAQYDHLDELKILHC